jgi:hypothetical protein
MGTLATSTLLAGASITKNHGRKRASRENRFGICLPFIGSHGKTDENFDSAGQDGQLLAVPFPADYSNYERNLLQDEL